MTDADHNRKGNCWSVTVVAACTMCGTNNVCDVCHAHDMPRGECDECPQCEACDD